ncbi:MAG: hypothetical protein A2539_08750 [Elusimicrobia bacterium RIFOXYD2_FULL_34_15]|nr:MAG: hypothetical protein A2539_08750 [Elusimicrobia bacterium RIFOXYD2_FULL_34_15]
MKSKIKINEYDRITKVKGKIENLTKKEMYLLLLLLKNQGKLLNYKYLFEKVWGYEKDFHIHTLECQISNLKKKLKFCNKKIKTVRGSGYKLID